MRESSTRSARSWRWIGSAGYAVVLATTPFVSAAELSGQVRAEVFTRNRPDAHGPAGLRADHILERGQIEVGYRLENRDLDGLREGSDEVAVDLVLRDYPFAPASRRGFEHTLGLRYGASDALTLQVEVPYLSLESGHLVNGGNAFATESSGLGDIRATALFQVYAREGARAHLGLGASVPTGAIDQVGATPLALSGTTLPYGMQLGSGTFDALPSVTMLVQNAQGSFGAQLDGRVHLHDNDRGYRLGNRVGGSAWLAPRVTGILSLSFRIRYENFDGVQGLDSTMDANADPTADAGAQGGEFVEIPVGLNLYLTEGAFAGHRLNAEVSMPVHQDYDGIQPNRNFRLSVIWRKAF